MSIDKEKAIRNLKARIKVKRIEEKRKSYFKDAYFYRIDRRKQR